MDVVALILYAAACVCFVIHAGNAKVFGLNAAGLGLACCALLWSLQELVPLVSK
jgi:hypothetical protein